MYFKGMAIPKSRMKDTPSKKLTKRNSFVMIFPDLKSVIHQ
ncbi:hypothetical protein [Moraxella lacunata]